MSNYYKAFIDKFEDSVSTATLGAVFSVAAVMGLISVSGILVKPYEAREVVSSIHQRILLEKRMREYSRITYAVQPVSYVNTSAPGDSTDVSYFSPKPQPVKNNPKTDRAQDFNERVRSEDYWASLGDSLKQDHVVPSAVPVVIPPVIVGVAD